MYIAVTEGFVEKVEEVYGTIVAGLVESGNDIAGEFIKRPNPEQQVLDDLPYDKLNAVIDDYNKKLELYLEYRCFVMQAIYNAGNDKLDYKYTNSELAAGKLGKFNAGAGTVKGRQTRAEKGTELVKN